MPSKDKRKLAAIMFADVVGYSRMMANNEERTLELLKDFENICSPIISKHKGEYDKALEYFHRSLKIDEEVDDKLAMVNSLNNIGGVYYYKGYFDKALSQYVRSLKIREKIGDKRGMGDSLSNIGSIYYYVGDYNNALDYYFRSLKIRKEISDKHGIGVCLGKIGIVYKNNNDCERSVEYLQKSLSIKKEIELRKDDLMLETNIYLHLEYKNLGKKYNKKDILQLINDTKEIRQEMNYRIYQLLEDVFYLNTVYNQVQEKVDNLEPDVAAKFLSYPIPKAIVKEWEKVK